MKELLTHRPLLHLKSPQNLDSMRGRLEVRPDLRAAPPSEHLIDSLSAPKIELRLRIRPRAPSQALVQPLSRTPMVSKLEAFPI